MYVWRHHWEGANRSVCGSFQAYPQWSYYLGICMVWWLDCFLFSLFFSSETCSWCSAFLLLPMMMRWLFFCYRWRRTPSQYTISHKNYLFPLKILTPTHLMVSKSIRPSPGISSDIQNLSNPHQACSGMLRWSGDGEFIWGISYTMKRQFGAHLNRVQLEFQWMRSGRT